MKIVKVEDMHCDGGHRNLSFVKVTTDEGLVGWAESSEGMAGPGLTMVIRKMSEGVIGMDPCNVGVLDAKLYAQTRMAEGGAHAQAAGAIVNACLDIKGKAANLRVADLYGGPHRTRIPIYWSHCGTYRVRHADFFEKVVGTPPIRTLDDIVKLGQEVVAKGFRAMKSNILIFDGDRPRQYRPGFGAGPGHPELNYTDELVGHIEDELAAFRQGIGPKTGLLLDLNSHFKPEGLRRVAKAVEKFHMFWLEIDTYEPNALAGIRNSTDTPIAALESVYGRRALKPFLEAHAVDVAIIDVQWNGFMEGMRLATLADIYEVNCAAHDPHSHLSTIMGGHFAAAIPNFRIMEVDIDDAPWTKDFFTHPMVIEDGFFLLPSGPGWGCDINEEAVLAHPPKNVGFATWMLDWHRAKGVVK